MKINDGYIPYLGYKTHYRIVGELKEDTIPLIILHGGPGSTLYPYEPFYELNNKGYTIILYDQLGSGLSKTPKHLFKLMNFETFENELINLVHFLKIKKCHLLGHSWGGMLILNLITTKKVSFIKSIILFSTLPSTKMWKEEGEKLIRYYPPKLKESFYKAYQSKKYDSKYYKLAVKKYIKEHVRDKKLYPYTYQFKPKLKANSEIYNYMWGKNEIFSDGTLASWDVSDKLKEINYKTLIISGTSDESTPYINKFMNENIKNSTWVLLKNSSHCGYINDKDLVIETLDNWMKK